MMRIDKYQVDLDLLTVNSVINYCSMFIYRVKKTIFQQYKNLDLKDLKTKLITRCNTLLQSFLLCDVTKVFQKMQPIANSNHLTSILFGVCLSQIKKMIRKITI